jgi:hypothetical protein
METFFTIYRITNKLNGKTYIGSHKTRILDDGYMGSGTLLKRAIKKYGVDNFEKEVLHIFGTSKEMYAKEAELVTEDHLMDGNTYNLKVGGFGGFDYLNETGKNWNHSNRKNSNDNLDKGRVSWTTKSHNESLARFKKFGLKCAECLKYIRYAQYCGRSTSKPRNNWFCNHSCSAKYNNRLRKITRN